ncbi:MAG: hypothetical protein LBE12_17700, partial [Planctomycetaceae bacterium]|nr:hypothetical protein [Planctomycetaceae bacterium]
MRHYPLSTLNYQLLSRHCRALEKGRRVPAPAVALRLTAGYAFHTPSGVKSKKQKFHGYIEKNTKNIENYFQKT